ncbi:hypothetical protein IEI94_12065 [Halomonas sp. ML-15]|uniref:hypothetical protein n=1 Tax=Halomonas sp. ML-15 TaxID=2773305 RepID=UPI0017472470|nr:hypothetical protein [Halomonas sp. ML-15]MBD3896586.1 hypothetical protein [Halomonas sp. ML-15]
MKRCTFMLCSHQVELVMTRDPETQDWLAMTRWHLDEHPAPIVKSMPSPPTENTEDEAWEAAQVWAGETLASDWTKLSSLL